MTKIGTGIVVSLGLPLYLINKMVSINEKLRACKLSINIGITF
jgi:hypothetical protein